MLSLDSVWFSRNTLVRLLILMGVMVSVAGEARADQQPRRVVRLMAVGDSITEGAEKFSCYRHPLWEKLFAAGYVVEFVGTRTAESRVGPLAHEGYGGKNTEFLAREVSAHFREHPADIVLLHSGHNHTVEEQPVPGIVAATERLITAFREANPHVTVLLAQVIPAGKLPKYAYIPELNRELALLAARLDQPAQRVVLVDQASGFDWRTDTIEDKVHPNAQGAEKMAETWFRALTTVLPAPPQKFSPTRMTYKSVGATKLDLQVFSPEQNTSDSSGNHGRPAVLFFFGGGWRYGTPVQFYPECARLSDRGMVTISVDYRIASINGTTPFDAIADAKSAVQWVRAHAAQLGVDPHRIYAAGASAGGHLAACAALDVGEVNNHADVSSRPDALLLWYPVLDVGPKGFEHALFGERFKEASPVELAHTGSGVPPPTLIMIGTADEATPMATVQAFQEALRARGGRCEVVTFPDRHHPLYQYRGDAEPLRTEVLRAAEKFVDSLPGSLRPTP
jgi:acetyl esterase